MKPLINWAGGKSLEIKFIEKYLPEKYDTYIEPFIGGGSLFFHLGATKNIISDIHKELIYLYKSIKNGHSKDIYNFMKENPNDAETYYKIRDTSPIDELQCAKRFYYLKKTCYRGMMRYNKKGKFNICFGKYKNINFENLLDSNYESLFKNTEILNCSYSEIFEKYNDENNFVFLDPPYDCVFKDYGYCNFTKEDHIKLSEYFKTTKNKCLMIISKTDFIEGLYKDYIVEEYVKNYRIIINKQKFNSIHLVIKNY